MPIATKSAVDVTLREIIAPIVRELLIERGAETLMVSQLNSETTLGISARMHMEYCRRVDFAPRVLRIGRLRMVDARAYVAWLRELDERGDVRAGEPIDDADAVLAELGIGTKKGGRP